MLKIALLQIAPGDTLEENLKKGVGYCRRAAALGADIALFPEMWSSGYRIYNRPAEEWTAEAVPVDGAFAGAFGGLARELHMAVGITLLERWEGGGPRNTLVLFDRFGERRLVYDQPPLRAAGPGLREHGGHRHLQLPGHGPRLQRRLQRL